MRRVRKISIRKYILIGILSILVAMSAIALLFINILAEEAIQADIRTLLKNEARENSRYLSYEDGKIVTTEDFEGKIDGISVVVIDQEKTIYVGSYPETFEGLDLDQVLPRRVYKVRGELIGFSVRGEDYYLLDRVHASLTGKMGKTILLRCVVKQNEIYSKYHVIKSMSYISIPIILAVACIFSYFLAKRFTDPIKQLCAMAESIRFDGDLSQRINYSGRFQELAALSEENNRMLDKLESIFRSQKRFNSDVAHELRNPMAVILTQCEYTKAHLDDRENMEETMEIIYRQAVKTNNIVQQLLKLSRLERNNVVLNLECVNLNDILQMICEEEELKSQKEVDILLPQKEIDIFADITLIMMLFQNLINNAIKYSMVPVVIEIQAWESGEYVITKIKDNGCGISVQEQENIFTPFYRVDQSRNSEGVGLGLSIAMQVAELHKGKIEIESEEGKGSIFTVYLPQKK